VAIVVCKALKRDLYHGHFYDRFPAIRAESLERFVIPRERIHMDRLKGLPLGRQLILGAGVLLLIDTFLDWQQVSVFGTSAGNTAWHGFLGIVMCLALVVLLVWTIARAFEIALPVDVPDGLTSLGLSVLIFVFALLKALTDDFVHWPAWAGVVLAAVMVYGGWLVFSASGETMPNFGSMGSSTASADSAPPPTAPPTTDE
jgi:hypothetical protein